MVKLALDPSSSRSKPKTPPGILTVRRSLLALVGRKQTVVRISFFFLLRNPPARAFVSRAQRFCTPLARRRLGCPSSSLNMLLARPIERVTVRLRVLRRPTGLSATVPLTCLSSATSSRRAPNWRSGRGGPVDTILNQPNRRRVSTGRLNRVDSQLVASPEGEFGPTLAGKTLPHSYPKNSRLRGEWAFVCVCLTLTDRASTTPCCCFLHINRSGLNHTR